MAEKPERDLEPLAVGPDTAARLLGIGRTQIYGQMAAGNLPFIHVGAHRRIPMTALRRAVEEGLPLLARGKGSH